MEYFVISFVVMALAFLGMSVGVLCGRRPPPAGCGDAACDRCMPREDGP